jgi:hypothetical protein
MASKFPKHGVGAEIGVQKGHFSAQLLRLARPTRLHLIDPWMQTRGEEFYDGVCRRFATKIERGTVIIHRARSADVAGALEDLDWVYIDGNHEYQAVKEDLAAYNAIVKPGGTIAGDDYGMSSYAWGDGVREAVDEFVNAHGYHLTLKGNQFIITKPG